MKRLIFITFFAIGGCEDLSEYEKAQAGMKIGAVIGGLAGALSADNSSQRQEKIRDGAILGALIGGGIGLYLDTEDRRRQRAAAASAVTRNAPVSWSNPDTGISGRIAPVSVSAGSNCGIYSFEYGRNGTPINRGDFRACRDNAGNITSLPV
jgi:surface antigen